MPCDAAGTAINDAAVMAQKLRVPLGFVIAAAVFFLAQPTLWSVLAGLPVALIGVAFRALAAGVIKKDSALATSGVYAVTRNPLYLGSSLLAAGFAIMSASQIAAALLLIPFALIYPAVMLREGAHLERLFPDEFRLYKSKVPRFFPRLTFPFRPAFHADQYLSNREYNTALGFMAALCFFLLKWWLGA
jgi:protein-S-isoprenylcysteine O-methyltransferase Ste14